MGTSTGLYQCMPPITIWRSGSLSKASIMG
jgi:hypothetical protein